MTVRYSLLALTLLAIYGSHIQHAPFVYEDDRMQYGQPAASESWGQMLTTGRGVTNQTWHWIRTPRGAHALNLLLHLMNVGLVGLLVWRITRESWAVGGAATVMALHPLTVESVAYAVSRAELLAALGALLALLAVTARTPGVWLLTPLGLLLAYAGKETGLVVVALIPLVLWAMRWPTRTEAAVWLIWGGLAVTSAVWAPYIPALLVVGHMPQMQVDGLTWLSSQAEAVWRLVVLSVVPWPGWLSVTPVASATWVGGLAAVVLLVGLLERAWHLRTTAPLFTLGVCWCAVVALPRFFVRTPLSPFNEHQWYLALVGVACAVVAVVDMVATWGEARWSVWREARCPA